MSRSRPETISTHRLIPDAYLVVPKSEIELYRPTGLPITAIPDEIRGASRVKNWILRHFDERIIVILDDDVTAVACMVGRRRRFLTVPEIAQVIERTAICADDLGVSLFGWNQSNGDVRKTRGFEPFGLTSWVSGILGVIGRDFYWDEELIFRSDADFNLRHLLEERVIWSDQRFSFVQKRETNRGGNALYRTAEKVEREMRVLKRRWGQYISFKRHKGVVGLTLSVPRRQSLPT
ncbi:hypothetical protein K8I61_17350 [bacterium]|nr:hypothetical protein [bacterium]